jgi:hypothetical protein
MLADTNHRIPKIATFKNKKTVTPGSRRVGPRSGPVAIDVVSSWWRPWSKPPAASRIFKAARCRCVRPDRRRAVAAHCRHMPHETRSPPCHGHRGRSRPPPVRSLRPPTATCHMRPDRHRAVVEAASRQSDLRGCPLPPRETRPPPRRAHRGRSHPPRHGCMCMAWWGGRERGAAAALVLVRWLLGWEEVASHAPPSRHLHRLASCHRKNKRRERENGRYIYI